jgi:hypothetical protein
MCVNEMVVMISAGLEPEMAAPARTSNNSKGQIRPVITDDIKHQSRNCLVIIKTLF